MILRFQRKALLGFRSIEGNKFMAATPFERVGVAMRMVEEVVQRGEEKRAEAPASWSAWATALRARI